MHLRKAVPIGFALLALLSAMSVRPLRSVPAVHAAASWEVAAGAAFPDENLAINGYLPDVVTVNVGDTVRWTLVDPHTVTFLGATGNPAALPQFVPGGPFPDGRVAGSGFSPIGAEGPYNGTDLVSSGRAVSRDDAPFLLSFTNTGVFRYGCLVHPGMSGTITAIPAGAALPETPAQAQARGQKEGGARLNNIRSGVQTVRLSNAAAPTGTHAHTVAAGISGWLGASALQFVPAELSVQRGDLVTWEVTDPLEAHTVTFMSGAGAPDFAEVIPQPDGTFLFAQRPEVFQPVGGSTYTGQGFLNSGQLFGGARGRIAFVAEIDAPAGTYEYQCLIHPDMKATITVTE